MWTRHKNQPQLSVHEKYKDFTHHSYHCPIKSLVSHLLPCDLETQPPFIQRFHQLLDHLNPSLHPLLLTREQKEKSKGKFQDSAWKVQFYSIECLLYSTVQNCSYDLLKTAKTEKWCPAVHQGRQCHPCLAAVHNKAKDH